MKYAKYACILSIVAANSVYAANQGQGTVTFTGSIIDAPCSITPDTSNQTVEMGQISTAAIEAGPTTPVPFEIELENCTLSPDNNSVSVTFNGTPNYMDPTLLGLSGTGARATAVGIAIGDSSNQKITLGSPSAVQPLLEGHNTLQFSAWLDDIYRGWDVVYPGDFSAVANFTLDYQ